jgi:hypothetical protein
VIDSLLNIIDAFGEFPFLEPFVLLLSTSIVAPELA